MASPVTPKTPTVSYVDSVAQLFATFSAYSQKLLSGWIPNQDGPGRKAENRFADDDVRNLINAGRIVVSEDTSKASDPSDSEKKIEFKTLQLRFKDIEAAITYWDADENAFLADVSDAASAPLASSARNAALRENVDSYMVGILKSAKQMVKAGIFVDEDSAVKVLTASIPRPAASSESVSAE